MKKIFLTILMVLLLAGAVYATQAVTFMVSPWSIQLFDSCDGSTIHSRYGLGGMFGYEATPIYANNFYAGFDTSFLAYFIRGYEHSFMDVQCLAKAGYRFDVVDRLSITPYFRSGLQIQIFEKLSSTVFSLGPALDISVYLDGPWSVCADFLGTFSFPNTKEGFEATWSFEEFLGVKYTI